MRLFFAVKLSDDIQARLYKEQTGLRATGADVKWVEPHNIHVTLKFLGEVDEKSVPDLEAAAGRVAQSAQPFNISISGIGCFPTPRSPRVIWAGITQGAQQMAALAGQIEEALEPLGFQRENRPFKAHATLGRVRSPRGKEALADGLTRAAQVHGGDMLVDHFSLVRSDLRPSGPVYTVLKDFALRAG